MSSQLLEYIKQETKKVLNEEPFGATSIPTSYTSTKAKAPKAPKANQSDPEKEPSILDFFGKDTKNSIKKLKSKLDSAAEKIPPASEASKLSEKARNLLTKIEKLEADLKAMEKKKVAMVYIRRQRLRIKKAKDQFDVVQKALKATPEGQKVAKMFSPEAVLAFGQKMGDKVDKKLQGSGRKRKRHPLRAKQERLSRRIKIPVAKIQDMLKPYFAGGGRLTFKESINRNIILEGDGAYGDETEAAIKAFQAQVNDLIEKGILKGVKSLGTPDGLFGPASLRAFRALKKQPEALAQSKLGSAQVDPSTLAGGARQAAAQAAADVGPQQPVADQGPPAPQKSNFTTLGQQKGFFGNTLELLINAGGGGQTFTALQKVWEDSNIEDTPPPRKLLKMYGTFLVKTTLTPDTMIPNQAMLNQLPNPVKMEEYIEKVLYKQAVVDQLSNPNSAIYKLTSRLFKTQDALQLFLKQPDDSVAKVTNAEKKKVEKPFYEIDKDIKARKKTADDGAAGAAQAGVATDQARMQSYNTANESKAYTYLKKIINEELDKILG